MTAKGGPFAPGSTVEHYRILRVLGRGGMGEVVLARDTELGRRVALKVIHPHLLVADPDGSKFLYEARATARFSHPHIVLIYGVGRHRTIPYMALEYLEGQTLRRRIAGAPLGERECVRVGLAIAEALRESHRHGLVHGDLKPRNILIPTDGRIRVLDFGLARLVAGGARVSSDPDGEDRPPGVGAVPDAPRAETTFGSPQYMAPERWLGDEPGATSDIWALGAILYELIARKRPYDHADISQLGSLIVRSAPPRRVDRGRAVRREFADLIEHCLRKDPQTRPDAVTVATRLRDLLAGRTTSRNREEAPFRGLRPFSERHAHLFHGREAEIDALLERLREQTVVPLVGASGVGKSSFVRAGLIPRLREQGSWVVIRIRPGRRRLEGHDAEVIGVAFSPDGNSIATGSFDQTVRIWDLRDGSSRILGEHEGRVYWLGFSPDGEQLGTSCADGTARLWEVATGDYLELRGHRGESNAIRFSYDGRWVATGGDDGTLRVWDARSGRARWRGIALFEDPPRLLDHRGWTGLSRGVAPGSPAPGSDWVRALEKRAVLARGGEHGTPLCLLTTADELELWNTDDDALLGRLDVGAVDELAAVSTGCVTRSGSSVQLHALDGSTRHLSADARAIALDGDQILVATDAQLTAFDHKGVGGESVGIGPATTALARVGEWLVLGFEDGNVERHRPGDASQRSALPFTSTASSAVVRMVAAPPGTVVVGYANGHVGLWSVDNGSLLHSARLHGPVSHLRVVGGQLVAGENMSRHTRFLAKVHGFDTLDRRGRRAFADRMRESTYGTGQYILKKGDRPADST